MVTRAAGLLCGLACGGAFGLQPGAAPQVVPRLAPPQAGAARPLLLALGDVAAFAVRDLHFIDPLCGTWKDHPTGGGAERDGSWLASDLRNEALALLQRVALNDDGSLSGAIAECAPGGENVLFRIASGERFDVRIFALAAGGDAARDTQPCGTVVLSRVLEGRVDVVPLRRSPFGPQRDAEWLKRDTSARSYGAGAKNGQAWTMLGGPPREAAAAGKSGAVVVDVVLRPPRDETITVDGSAGAALIVEGTLPPDLVAKLFVDAEALLNAPAPAPVAQAPVAQAPLLLSTHVGGLEDVVEELSRRLLASRRLSSHDVAELGVSHVRGALLYGPPGCGKTLLARHVAAALGCDEDRVSVVNGPELLDKFVGVAEERVRALFDRPKAEWARYVIKTAGAVSDDASGFKRANVMPKINVVIFDEIDAICRKRGSLADSTGVRDSVTAQLLASIDGVEDAGNLIVLATTNMPELLDPALLRPGRLEVKVRVNLPGAAARRSIADVHLAPLRRSGKLSAAAAARLDSEKLYADDTKGFSGAEIAGLVRATVSRAIARALDGGAPLGGAVQGAMLIEAADVDEALAEVFKDRLAQAAATPPAWPQLAGLEALWLERRAGPPRGSDAMLDFLEQLAFDERLIELPRRRAEVDDLAYNLYRYLTRGAAAGRGL